MQSCLSVFLFVLFTTVVLVCFIRSSHPVLHRQIRTTSDQPVEASRKLLNNHRLNEDKKHVLITGGAGFVGRRFSSTLCRQGWVITIVDNLVAEGALLPEKWPKHLQCEPNQITFIQNDCREFFASDESHVHYDLFIHLAAVVGGRVVIENMPLQVADDLSIDASAFRWAIDETNKKMPSMMIYFSSSAAYPVKMQQKNSNTQLTEDLIDIDNPLADIAKPDLTYGWAKLTGEYLASLAIEKYGLKVAIYRPMSGYGEDQHETYPFKAILNRALNKENPINIWSNATRDFFYIQDVVDCVLSTMDKASDGKPINLATGYGTDFTTLAKKMAKQLGYEADVALVDNKPKGVDYRVGSSKRLEELGCISKTSIDEGIRLSIDYMQGKDINPILRKRELGEGPSTHIPTSVQDDTGEKSLDNLRYSEFQCIAGSQKFPGHLQKTHALFPDADNNLFRVCHLQNVCLKDGVINYYLDPKLKDTTPGFLHPEAFEGAMVTLGYYPIYHWSPNVIIGDRPRDIPFHERNVHLLSSNSFSDNIGHHLNDDIIPGFIAMDIFNFTFDNAQMMLFTQCAGDLTGTSPFNGRSRHDNCMDNFNSVVPLFHDHPVMWLNIDIKETCFRNVLVGQSSAFSLKSLELGRGFFLRKVRDRLVKKLSLGTSRFTRHRILVALKRASYAAPEIGADICDKVRSLTPAGIEIECFDPVGMSFEEQVRRAWECSIFIAEHGTVSYIGLFAREHSALITIGNDALMKEPQVWLYTTHMQALYMSSDHMEDLEGMLRYAMHRVAVYHDMPDVL